MLMAQPSMAQPVPNWLGWLTTLLAGLLFSLMLGQSGAAGWQLWRATQRLTQATRSARLSLSPVVDRLARRLDLSDGLVVVPNREPLSFCYGLWRPRICLSQGLIDLLLTETELEAVLWHEVYHLRRREPLRMAVAICLSRFFFFVPLLAELRDHYLAEKELAADAFAVAHTDRPALARALHKIITIQPVPTISSLGAVAGLSVTARRVDRLLNPAARPNWRPSRRSMLSVLVLFAVGCLFMFAGMV
jgi:Zn-dependent protease with chaperone function